MCLANGYMGVRSATEESYVKEHKSIYVAGTFSKHSEDEVTELPNIADVITMEIVVEGDTFSLVQGRIHKYSRRLNLKNGELIREITWESPSGTILEMIFKRMVSLSDIHTMAQQISIKPINKDASISVKSSIDAKVTNEGAQHFVVENKRFYDFKYMQLIEKTKESKVTAVVSAAHNVRTSLRSESMTGLMGTGLRHVEDKYSLNLSKGETLIVDKVSMIHTSRDVKWRESHFDVDVQMNESLEALKTQLAKGYDGLLEESGQFWQDQVWNRYTIDIESSNNYDQLALRFAVYHLVVMTPRHDNRLNIAAKGLSGPGYKGHYFWDTEIFMLPFFTFMNPEIARKLLEYRYLSLDGARRKAAGNDCKGAQYPWEAAWVTDGEVTPEWGGQDPISGELVKIWSGFIEIHITSDIAFAVWQYFKVTNDVDFMEKYGYEMIFDTAKFWISRFEEGEDGKLVITDIVGPDEYKEHKDNNAFTNHMAHFNIELAMDYYNELKDNKPELFAALDKKLDLVETHKEWTANISRIYLPSANQDGIIPQDDTYLDLKEIDLSKYKNSDHVGSIFHEYTLKEVNMMKASKQADIMMLLYLLEDRFDKETVARNFDYYEPFCMHDSSLSLAMHSILASDLDRSEMAYDLFHRATLIDMGQNMKSSNAGMHMAAQGGLWQATVFGFGGMRVRNGALHINPQLPKEWSKLHYPVYWKGQRIDVYATADEVKLVKEKNNESITMVICEKEVVLEDDYTSNRTIELV